MKTRMVNVWAIALVGVLVATLLAYPQVSAAQATDPVSLIQARNAAMNAGDLESALAFYADGATIRDRAPEPGTTGVIQGKEEIREFLAENIAMKIRLESYDFQLSGETISFRNHVWFDDPDLIRLNLLPIDSEHTVVFRDGKIQDWLSGITGEWLARADAAFAADQGALGGMPRTGVANYSMGGWAWLAVAAVLAGMCGLVLRHATSGRRL
jgi:hypothetical protein